MKKYFFVTNSSRAGAYGIGTYSKQMMKCLNSISQLSLSVIELSSDAKELTVKKDDDGCLHFCIPDYQHAKGNSAFFRAVTYLLNQYVDNDDTLIIHINYYQHLAFIKILKEKFPNAYIVFSVHYQNWGFQLNGNLSKLSHILETNSPDGELEKSVQRSFAQEEELFSFCDKIVVLSRFTYDILIKYFHIDSKKLHLIYNGYDNKKDNDRYESQDNQNYILYIGRLDDNKGIDYLVEAFRIVSSQRPQLRLVLIGDGEFSHYLKTCEGIWEKVIFTGRIDKSQMKYFYKKSIMAVLPSFNEQCSYSVIELMSYGIPIIATDSTGLGEMMDYTPNLRIHIDEMNFEKEKFVNNIVEKMNLLLNDNNLRDTVSKQYLKLFRVR